MAPLATVGILSIGDMGMGIAKLLIAHNYHVVTNLEGRSEETHARVVMSNIEVLETDTSVIEKADYILSIVPPRDALATATRITTAFKAQNQAKRLCYMDLNAISPRSAREIGTLFQTTTPSVKYIDGGIIGGPPNPTSTTHPSTTVSSNSESPSSAWNRPSIPLSGPHELSTCGPCGQHLAETLNSKHISPEIGSASGLKCCFASTSKGFTALCIQAFTTAQNLGVLPLLQEEMEGRMPGLFKAASGVVRMPPKAYRWVREMEEIAITHADEGGFAGGPQGGGLFGEVAKVYKSVAEDTVLGLEKIGKRKRGLTIEDVAEVMSEGLDSKKRKAGTYKQN